MGQDNKKEAIKIIIISYIYNNSYVRKTSTLQNNTLIVIYVVQFEYGIVFEKKPKLQNNDCCFTVGRGGI
eukprot:UN06113